MNVYKENGYENRADYLRELAGDYEVPVDVVFALADMLGENEDFDGLVTELEDFSMFY